MDDEMATLIECLSNLQQTKYGSNIGSTLRIDVNLSWMYKKTGEICEYSAGTLPAHRIGVSTSI
jgi:hypothetical protein